MKRLILLFIGFLPLILGFLVNYGFIFEKIMHDHSGFFIHFFVGVVLFISWFFIGIISITFIRSRKEFILFLNSPSFLMLLFQFFHVIILGYKWSDYTIFIGKISWMFYFLFKNLNKELIGIFYHQSIHDSSLDYIVPFISLLILSSLGRVIAEHWKRNKKMSSLGNNIFL